jgi:hypothetical protein
MADERGNKGGAKRGEERAAEVHARNEERKANRPERPEDDVVDGGEVVEDGTV